MIVVVRTVSSSTARRVAVSHKGSCQLFSPHASCSTRRTGAICRYCYAEDAQLLQPCVKEVPGKWPINKYDGCCDEEGRQVDTLKNNKAKLKKAFKACKDRNNGNPITIPENHQALMLAMAMQETNHMDVNQRDRTKDFTTDRSKNYTAFNLSEDFIEKTGYYWEPQDCFCFLTEDQKNHLNSDAGLPDAVGIIEKAFKKWGVENSLAFVRQGSKGFDPDLRIDWRDFLHYSDPLFNVCEYLCCIKRYLHYIDDDHDLFDNEFRPDIPCNHI